MWTPRIISRRKSPAYPSRRVRRKKSLGSNWSGLHQEEKEERDREQNVIPSLGVRIGIGEVTEEGGVFPDGLPVAEVLPGSSAEKGGLLAGDKIKKIDGKMFSEDPEGFFKGWMAKPGTVVKITVVREGTGKEEEIELTIGDWDYEELLRKAME